MGTLVGFLIFMLLLLLCVQVLVRLYASSTLSAAANQAADQVSEAGGFEAEVLPAQREAVSNLGGFGAHDVRFDWVEVDPQQVVLTVTANTPGFLPIPGLSGSIAKTVQVRTERFR